MSSFYVIEGEQARLPCASWPPGNATCEIKWHKVYTFFQLLLLSSNKLENDFGVGLGNDFGLIINSVTRDHAGKYRCGTGSEAGKTIDVLVIGRCGQFEESFK